MTRTLHVAMDARKLLDGGIGTYIRELLAAYATAPGDDTFSALLDPRDADHVPERIRVVPVSAGKYGFAEHFVVPSAARGAGAHLLHEPHYTLPYGWSGPCVVTVHDLIHLKMARFYPWYVPVYARAVIAHAVSRARVVLADSNCTRDDLREHFGVPDDRVVVTPLGVSATYRPASAEECAAFRAARGLPQGYVLYVGARKGHKNLSVLLRAWAAMPEGDRPPLVLSGEAWAAGDPLALEAEALGVSRWVRFSGGKHDGETGRLLYASAALYVQPSLYEGFGLPPIEAMACGTPVLSSDGGSLREVTDGGAEVIPPHDAAQWAERVPAILGDGELRAAMSERGLKHAARYRWAETARLTRAAYVRAMQG